MRIAVIGSGISGLAAAWALNRRYDVTVYEADQRLGGHANTVEIPDPAGAIPVDTGFIVYNEANYPNLVQLFHHLDVPTEPSEMSFSVSRDRGGFEYRARAAGLFAQPSNLGRPGHLRMIRDVIRFTREAPMLLRDGTFETTGELLDRMDMSSEFRRDFLLPMLACIWSSSLETMLDYPAESMVRFLDNHGLLNVLKRPRWRTVSGGSREYVSRISSSFAGGVRLGTPVERIERTSDEVAVHDSRGGIGRFDQIVVATHADTALEMLGRGATEAEREVLSAFRYQRNRAVLHRDPTLMPKRRRAWSSWNYLAAPGDDGTEQVSLSYWMNRLQNLETERPVIVTLNPGREPRDIEREFTYDHPQYDQLTVAAQGLLPSLQGSRRTWFCGSYHGSGFHEDGLRAGLAVAADLGSPAPWWSTSTPAERTGRAPIGTR